MNNAISTMHPKPTPPPPVETSTTLPDVVTSPWVEGYRLGGGVDGVTGELKPAVFKEPIPLGKSAAVKSPVESFDDYNFIDSQSDLTKELEVSASGGGNIRGTNVSAEVEYLAESTFSSLSTSLVLKYREVATEYETFDYQSADVLETPVPPSTITNSLMSPFGPDPNKFRERYGDYFVGAKLVGSSFQAVIRCKARSSAELKAFKASVDAKMKGRKGKSASASAAVDLESSLKSNNIEFSVHVFMSAHKPSPDAPSAPWDLAKIATALEWFKKNAVAQPLSAQLYHYSARFKVLPTKISVHPDVYTALRELYRDWWDLQYMYHHCPAPKLYREPLRQEFMHFSEGVVANRSNLVSDGSLGAGKKAESLRAEYHKTAESLRDKLSAVRDRFDVYSKLAELALSEPAQGAEHESTVTTAWSYGLPAVNQPHVDIKTEELGHHEDWAFLTKRSHTFEWQKDDALIVGWQIIANWHDGSGGSWKKACDRIIGTNRASVHIESDRQRGYNWTLKIHYVALSDYRFEEA